MLLQRLRDYASRLDLPPTLYAEGPVRYIVELSAGGRLLSPRPVDTGDPANARTRRGVRRNVPQIQRTSGIRPLLLADTSKYTFGLARDPDKQARADACHNAYLELVTRCAAETGELAAQAVVDFLAEEPTAQLDLVNDFDREAILTFRVDGVLPIDLPAVQAFWAREHDPTAADGADAQVMQCLVCGRRRPVLDRLQAKIKGVPGGRTSGTSIISANRDAFKSYGLRASLIAPTCAECGELFTKGLNALLAGENTSYRLGGVAFVFWTREPVPEFNPIRGVAQPDPQYVQALLESTFTGRPPGQFDATPFYASTLSGSGGRTVVRDWIDTTVGEVIAQLASWFRRQRIAALDTDDPAPLGLYALAAATVRDPRTDLAVPTPRALLRCALKGEPLPYGLLEQVVRRNRAEQRVTRPRAALIKLVLHSQQRLEEDAMVGLDLDSTNPAYRCGRLLAVLGQIQYAAIRVDSVVDRFYGSASTAPASVFGRLTHGAQHHLSKLQRDRPAAHSALRDRLAEIMSGIPSSGFPRTLGLEGQGLFALGFYHQRAHDRAQMRARVRERDAAAEADELNDLIEPTEGN